MMSELSELEQDFELQEEQDAGTWLSISDLMSGLLMFFALLFIVTQAQLLVKKIELDKAIERARRLEIELQAYKKAIDELPIRILNALEDKMGSGAGVLEVVPETGDVRIGDRILFDEGSAELKPEGKNFLKQFIPTYSQVIFSDALFEREVTKIIIEGRTSSKGTDIENMDLSLQRALSVVDYILSDELQFPEKQKLINNILPAGRGEIDANQKSDDPKDRIVLFRFQLRRQNFEQVMENLSKTELKDYVDLPKSDE